MPIVRPRPASVAAAAALAVVCALGPALPAAAHVSILPSTATPGEFLVYTASVPNELADQATVEVDLSLPAGFALDSAEQVPGWQTVVTKSQGGVPAQVAWRGGRIPVGTFARFSVQGRNPAAGQSLVWTTRQRYEHVTVMWDGPESAEHPASVVRLTGAAVGPSPAAPGPATDARGPNARASGQAGGGADQLARSRAAIALVLAGAALLLALASATRGFARRRLEQQPDPETSATPNLGTATTHRAAAVDRPGHRPPSSQGARSKEARKGT